METGKRAYRVLLCDSTRVRRRWRHSGCAFISSSRDQGRERSCPPRTCAARLRQGLASRYLRPVRSRHTRRTDVELANWLGTHRAVLSKREGAARIAVGLPIVAGCELLPFGCCRTQPDPNVKFSSLMRRRLADAAARPWRARRADHEQQRDGQKREDCQQ